MRKIDIINFFGILLGDLCNNENKLSTISKNRLFKYSAFTISLSKNTKMHAVCHIHLKVKEKNFLNNHKSFSFL